MLYFLEKVGKIAAALGGPPPTPPPLLASGDWRLCPQTPSCYSH